MAVIVIAEVHGQTEAGYDGMLSVLADLVRRADGFVLHSAYRTEDDSWRVVEVWESEEAARAFDEETLLPLLQSVGVDRPEGETWPVHNLVMRGG